MSEGGRTVELEAEDRSDDRPAAEPDARTDAGGGLRARLADRLRIVSLRGLALSFALALAGALLGGLIPFVGGVGRLLGLFGAAFALGLVGGRRRYVETGVAGAATGAVGAVLSAVGTLFLPVVAEYGVGIVGLGAGAGLAVSLLGHYLGRDLRAGLTSEL